MHQEEQGGWIYGVITNSTGIPLEDVIVSVTLADGGSRSTSSDLQGQYQLFLPVGDYIVEASKAGYTTVFTAHVNVFLNQAFEVNYVLEKTSVEPYDSIQEKINEAIRSGDVGGEISFYQSGTTILYNQTIYADLILNPTVVEENKISLVVNGEVSRGKTIVIDLGTGIFTSNDALYIDYDGVVVSTASSLTDVLNPNDDGSFPEYLIVTNPQDTHRTLFISIPHFSDHMISISAVVKTIQQNTIVVIVAAFVIILLAAFILFKKGNES